MKRKLVCYLIAFVVTVVISVSLERVRNDGLPLIPADSFVVTTEGDMQVLKQAILNTGQATLIIHHQDSTELGLGTQVRIHTTHLFILFAVFVIIAETVFRFIQTKSMLEPTPPHES